MLNTTWWGWEVGIQTFKTAELCCLFVASGSTYFPAKKCHPPKKPPSQPSMVGGWPPSMIFRSKMDPRLASSLTQEAWRQGTMNWTDGRDVNRTLSEIWRSYRGVVPKKSNPVHFGHNTNIIVAQDFFFFSKTRPCLLPRVFALIFVVTKRKAGKGVETMARLKGKMAVKKTFESTACVLLIWESRRPLKKSAIAKAERITRFFWLLERLETCKDLLF